MGYKFRQTKANKGFSQHLGLGRAAKSGLNNHHGEVIPDLSAGFTIIELMIATVIFSIILLVSLGGFLQIGRLFYKGATINQTTSTNQRLIDDIASALHASDSFTAPGVAKTGAYYFCAGNIRYTYKPGYVVGSSTENAPGGVFGLIKDSLSGASPCTNPGAGSGYSFNGGYEELLGTKMRVSYFSASLVAASSDLVRLNSVLAFGDDNTLDTPNSQTVVCKTSLSTGRFCSVSKLQTVVKAGE